jgi:hypothetical protein
MTTRKPTLHDSEQTGQGENHAPIARRPYETPHLEVIDLSVQEVLGGCFKVLCAGLSISMS